MKKQLFTIVFLFICLDSFSQDTLFKKDGSKIIAKVLEINPDEIKYKKFDFQQGPTYIDKKADFSMIIYSTGLKEIIQSTQPEVKIVQTPVTEGTGDYYGEKYKKTGKIEPRGSRYVLNNMPLNQRELHKVLLKTMDKEIILKVGRAKDSYKLQYVGFAGIPLGIASFLLFANSLPYSTPTGTYNGNKNLQTASLVCLAAAISCPIASGIFKGRTKKLNREAVDLYNQKY
ncbi:MAG: hypothetical protein M3R27_16220 [Bacteroidota bacterium]|nr:hypothetical protein [Bacteroidota bacterium]